MPERLECEVLQKARYINTLTYLPSRPKNACMDLDEVLSVDSCRDMEELINFCTNLPLNWYKLLIKTLSSALKTILHNAAVTL